MAEFLKIAELDDDGITKIKQLEQSLNTHIMAYQTGLKIANLTERQMAKIKAVEEELDVILLVFDENSD